MAASECPNKNKYGDTIIKKTTKEATFQDILLPSAGSWEKYLLKRSLMKHTFHEVINFLYYEH